MRAYYNVLDKLKEILEADPDVNTVTRGTIDEVAIKKITLYSLAHIMINSLSVNRGVVTFNISVIVMDIVNHVKEASDKLDETGFRGVDNEDDVLNTTSAIVVRLIEKLRRGDPHNDGYALNGNPSAEPFTDRFKDNVAGWVVTFNIDTAHNIKLC